MASKPCDDKSSRLESQAINPKGGRPADGGQNRQAAATKHSSSPLSPCHGTAPTRKSACTTNNSSLTSTKRCSPDRDQAIASFEDSLRPSKPSPPLVAPRGPVQVLTREPRVNDDAAIHSPAPTGTAVDPTQQSAGSGSTHQLGGKSKSKKRKPTLKTMSIGDMIPQGKLVLKKVKPPSNSATQPPSSTNHAPLHRRREPPSDSLHSTASDRRVKPLVSGPRVVNHHHDVAQAFDLSEFPALPAVSSSSAIPSARIQRHPASDRKSEALTHLSLPSGASTDPPASSRRPNPQSSKKGKSPLDPVSESSHAAIPAKKRSSYHPNKPGVSSSSAPSEEPKQRDVSGDEHALLRLMQQGKFVVQNKGRQRIRPRKKKFSALKKKVLHERLQKWRELHPPDEHATAGPASISADATFDSSTKSDATTVCLYGYIEPEELEDDDEYDEIVSNLRDMAGKIGPLRWVFVPRRVDGDRWASFVDFLDAKDATAAVACWSGLSLGGQTLTAIHKKRTSAIASEDEWCDWCLRMDSSTTDGELADLPAPSSWEIVLGNALTEDDMEDDECLEESLNDIKTLASQFGPVMDVRVEREPGPRVFIRYEGGRSTARKAAFDFGSVVIGGQTIAASVVEVATVGVDDDREGSVFVILDNVLNDDDLEDEECLHESLADIRELAQRFGAVSDVRRDSSESKVVRLSYNGDVSACQAAAVAFNAMTIGGHEVVARVIGGEVNGASHGGEQADPSSSDNTNVEAPHGPMMTGDKRVPEQYAECLRVPKVSGTGQPRKYASIVENENVKPLLTEMLGELMRLQKRAVEEKNAKARRRLVMGLREVARGIRAHKVKLVVMANNLDEYGAIDEKLQEIINLAYEEGVPVFFEFSKRALGKVLGKTIKIGVVGVQSPEGAHQQFKKLLALAPK